MTESRSKYDEHLSTHSIPKCWSNTVEYNETRYYELTVAHEQDVLLIGAELFIIIILVIIITVMLITRNKRNKGSHLKSKEETPGFLSAPALAKRP